jgi:hypothetical protein
VVQSKKKAVDEVVSTTTPIVYGLDPQGLNKAFPFHFIFNQKLEVLQCGKVSSLSPPDQRSHVRTHARAPPV